MQASENLNSDLTRRRLMALSGASLAGVAFPSKGMPASASVETYVVSVIRQKFAGHPRPLVLLLPTGSEANLQPVLAEFSRQTGIEVLVQTVSPEEVNTELMLDAMLGARKFDVALPATFALPDLVSAGAIRPLKAYAAQHEPAGFRDDVMYRIGDHVDGSLFGFQTDGDAYVMFYNKNMLMNDTAQKQYADRFGTALAVPQTWRELDQQMAFFHEPDKGRYGGVLFRTPSYMVWEWWVRFHANGAWPLSPDMVPQIDGDAGVAALEDMIRASEFLTDGADSMGLFDNWRRFEKGDAYANIGWGGTQKFLNKPGSGMRGKIVFGPTPGGIIDGQLQPVPYFNWGWNYVVSAGSAAPELAYLLCLFASSPNMSTLAVRQADGFFDPFRAEHYDDAGIVDAYSEPFLQVHREAMKKAIPDLYLKGQSDYQNVLAQGLDEALQGRSDPSSVLNRVAQKWELITSRAGRTAQIERWRSLRAAYPPHLRRVLRDI